MMTRHAWLWTLVTGCAVAGLVTMAAQPAAERRLGFTPAAYAAHRDAETRFRASIDTDSISRHHRALTERPHRSGTAGARAVAEYIETTLRRAGLEVEAPEYFTYLSAPRHVQLELVTPVQESLAVMEPADPRDPSTSHPDLDPGFIAYSASGDVTAPVVYANYGLPADYAQLKAEGIDVAGRIVLVRYARSHRAVKVFTAQEAGAAAVLLYSDPADDGARRGAPWPDGLWRAPHFIQRGNAKFSWHWHGDPLTPGYAATRDAEVLDARTAPTLPRIPVAVVSAAEAARVMARLDGREAPPAFRGGLDHPYRLGAGGVRLRINVQMQNERMPIRNVIGRIPGTAAPDRWIILGTHHDAWTFGGIDPGSSAAVILEVAERLGALSRTGWRPPRSLVFAFWDAEEYGLVGSTEFAEDRAADLQERAVVYLNSDMYTPGRLVAGGVPSLRDFVAELTRDVPPPGPAAAPLEELSALGSGADFVAFQDHLGISTLALEYLFEGGYGFGAYHSTYDSRRYLEHVTDPGFVHGSGLARLLGTAVMRLAAAPVLPFRPSHYATRIAAFLKEAEGWSTAAGVAVDVNTAVLQTRAASIAERARALETRLDAALAAGRLPANTALVNDRLMRLERTLLDSAEPADRRWYRHVIYGWNIYSMYDGQPLPGLFEAIRVGDAAAVAREQARIGAALDRMQTAVSTLEP